MPGAQRLGWGRTQCDSLLLGEPLPKIHKVGLSIPPAQNTFGGAPSFPYPTTPLTLWNPKPNNGQLTPKGHTWGMCFLSPPFCAHGQVNPKPKKLGVQFWEPPFWAPRVTCPFFQLWTPENQPTNWTTLIPTDTQPIARKPTYLRPNLN